MSNNELTVVINTFQSGEKIEQCLNSIDSEQRVLLIENSNDLNFKKKIENKYKNVICTLTGENLGYAKGNNLGLSMVKTKFALILNPDAILEKDTIKNFFICVNRIDNFAIIGPAVQDEFSSNDKNKDKDDLFEVDKLKGFAMFLNLAQVREIGFFDENFFIYLEETDLCKRLKLKDKKIFLDKNIKINHLGGSSHDKKINFEMELSRNWHWMWSKFYFNKKHYGYLKAYLKTLPNFASSIAKFLIYFMIRNKTKKSIYLMRLSGLLASYLNKASYYRPFKNE